MLRLGLSHRVGYRVGDVFVGKGAATLVVPFYQALEGFYGATRIPSRASKTYRMSYGIHGHPCLLSRLDATFYCDGV